MNRDLGRVKECTNVTLTGFLTDASIPTVVLDGISNTETGHCAKTMALVADMSRRIDDPDKRLDWLVIADDDTLLSVQRLERLLSCYDPSRPVLLGQRYGYANNHRHGYDYVTGKWPLWHFICIGNRWALASVLSAPGTSIKARSIFGPTPTQSFLFWPIGGGGMVLSRAAVQLMARSLSCRCPQADTPDDMWIGACASYLNIAIIHVSGFHQVKTSVKRLHEPSD
jgi:UDP-glucose:O-linked fucose beta-1,3-glucosyltransferase